MYPDKEPVFYKSNGDLTAYAFACGYVQRKEANGKWKEMYMEHGNYFVKSGKDNSQYDIWESFDRSIAKARAFYNKIKMK